MTQQRQTSMRFFIQMIINMYVCKKAQQIIAKQTIKHERNTNKSILLFAVFALLLFGLNQGAFFFFKDPNIYEQLGVPRRMSLIEVKQWSNQRLSTLRSQRGQLGNTVNQMIAQIQDKVNVLIHPARRLSYDSFGFSDSQYAWSFKYPSFLLQTIIQSAMFYIICTFMSLLNRKKGELKQAFKVQIFTMIILFIWEIDLIMSTESKLHNFQVDWLDYIYTAFPVFERREMIKVIIIPCMSLVQTFVRFFIISPAQKKIQIFGFNSKLREQTNAVRQTLKNIKMNQLIEQQVSVGLQKSKLTHPIQSQIYRLQRQLLKRVLFVEGQEILGRPQVNKILKYFLLA